METFNDIIQLTKKRVKFTDTDDTIDTVIKEGINHAYMNELAKEDKRIRMTYLIPVNGSATLPDDLIAIEKLEPELSMGDYFQGNVLFTSKTDNITLYYSYIRDSLIEDSDIPDINKKYFYCMSTYGCYAYYSYKKKTDLSAMYLNMFNSQVQRLRNDINILQTIQPVYGVM